MVSDQTIKMQLLLKKKDRFTLSVVLGGGGGLNYVSTYSLSELQVVCLLSVPLIPALTLQLK